MSPWISVRFLQTQSDERLVAAAREGHERAFEALVHRYRRPLLRYCRRLLLPGPRAEDAVQQGLLQAWLALQRGTEVRDVRAWLYRVVHNAAIDALRTSGYDHEQLSDSLEGATAPDSDLERRTAVRQALAGLSALPALQREALLRTAVEGHTHEQVAAALGLSDGAVRGLVYRARATLRGAATAITPPPLVAWIAEAGPRSAPLAERLGGAGAAGGSAGAAGALFKGGAAMLTAGALVAGVATVHHRPATRAHHKGAVAIDDAGGRPDQRSTGADPSTSGSGLGGTFTGRSGNADGWSAAGYRVAVRRTEAAGRHAPSPGAAPTMQSDRAGARRSSPGGGPQVAALGVPSADAAPEPSAGVSVGGPTGATGTRDGTPGDGASGGSDHSTELGDLSGAGGGSHDGAAAGTDASGSTGGAAHESGGEVGAGATGASAPIGSETSGSDPTRVSAMGSSGTDPSTPR
jgi:RNA polymerase sigma factor (sigma-70 family)